MFPTEYLTVKLKIFEVIRMSMYGLELFYNTKGCSAVQSRLSVSYQYTLKLVLGLPKYISKHFTFILMNMMIFKHSPYCRKFKLYD